MKSIKNLISITAFLVGTYQAVCIVDGAALLSSECSPLKLELRFMPPNARSTDGLPAPDEKQSLPRIHRAVVTPIQEKKSGDRYGERNGN